MPKRQSNTPNVTGTVEVEDLTPEQQAIMRDRVLNAIAELFASVLEDWEQRQDPDGWQSQLPGMQEAAERMRARLKARAETKKADEPVATLVPRRSPGIFGSAADEAWGYPFGVDGLMTVDAAGEFLSVSGRTLDRLAVKGKIRKGRFPSNVRAFCKRSIHEFAHSLEE